MRVVIELSAVNQRRYGPAWIATVTAWPIGKTPALRFGGRVDYNTAEIDAKANSLVKFGRKDHRGNNTENSFGKVEQDGTISILTNRAARDYWLAQQPEGTDG